MAFGGKSKEVNVYSTETYDLVASYNFKEEVSFVYFSPMPEQSKVLLVAGLSGKLTSEFF